MAAKEAADAGCAQGSTGSSDAKDEGITGRDHGLADQDCHRYRASMMHDAFTADGVLSKGTKPRS